MESRANERCCPDHSEMVRVSTWSTSSSADHLVTLGFGVSPPTLALVALRAAAEPMFAIFFCAAVIAAPFGVGPPGPGRTIGVVVLRGLSPTTVALLRLGWGQPSGGVAGADRTRGPLVGIVAVRGGAEVPSAVRFGVERELADEAGSEELPLPDELELFDD
jgi:hypothetical protein